MRILTMLCFFALLIFAGCTTTYYVPRDPDADEFIEARGNIGGRAAAVITLKGNYLRLDSMLLRADSLVGYDRDTHSAVVIPLLDVDEITATSIMRGFGRGVGQGIAIGGSFGLLTGVAFGGSGGGSDKGSGAIRGAFGGAFLGGIPGAVSGALFLSTEHYRFVNGGDFRIGRKSEKAALEGLSLSQIITLKLSALQDETPEAVSILWNGKPIWLPKSKIRIERGEGMISLTVPIRLLDPLWEK
jgi:hypothetical protein